MISDTALLSFNLQIAAADAIARSILEQTDSGSHVLEDREENSVNASRLIVDDEEARYSSVSRAFPATTSSHAHGRHVLGVQRDVNEADSFTDSGIAVRGHAGQAKARP